MWVWVLLALLGLWVLQRPNPTRIYVNKDSPVNRVLEGVSVLKQTCTPPFWLSHGVLQTIFITILNRINLVPRWGMFMKHPVKFSRELLSVSAPLNDPHLLPGILALDWIECSKPQDAPILLILPGLTGHTFSLYVQVFAEYFARPESPFRVVVVNYRGSGGVDLIVS